MLNAALAVADENGGLDAYEGWCLELVDDVLHRHPEADVLWVDLAGHERWKYHAVPVLDGIVHDAWHPMLLLPPDQYVERAFGARARSWELNPGADKEEIEEAYARVADAELAQRSQ